METDSTTRTLFCQVPTGLHRWLTDYAHDRRESKTAVVIGLLEQERKVPRLPARKVEPEPPRRPRGRPPKKKVGG
jgi:hypothetical protein